MVDRNSTRLLALAGSGNRQSRANKQTHAHKQDLSFVCARAGTHTHAQPNAHNVCAYVCVRACVFDSHELSGALHFAALASCFVPAASMGFNSSRLADGWRIGRRSLSATDCTFARMHARIQMHSRAKPLKTNAPSLSLSLSLARCRATQTHTHTKMVDIYERIDAAAIWRPLGAAAQLVWVCLGPRRTGPYENAKSPNWFSEINVRPKCGSRAGTIGGRRPVAARSGRSHCSWLNKVGGGDGALGTRVRTCIRAGFVGALVQCRSVCIAYRKHTHTRTSAYTHKYICAYVSIAYKRLPGSLVALLAVATTDARTRSS